MTRPRSAVEVLAALVCVLGVVVVVQTFTGGGGVLSVRFVVGVLFALAGAGRFYIARRTPAR